MANNLNLQLENYSDDSHILTEQTLIELNNNFTIDYEDDQNETIQCTDRMPICRYSSDRLDDTENFNEINICENYKLDRSLINIEIQVNADEEIYPLGNILETTLNSHTTTLTNFNNFSNRTINIEELTYEELIDLQDRVGFVSKGLSIEDINVKL